jgi:hypothetical protein
LLFLIIRQSVSLFTLNCLNLGLKVLFDQVIDVQLVVCLGLIRAIQLGDTLIHEEQVLQHTLKYSLGVLWLDICEVDLLTQDDCPRWDTIDWIHMGTCCLATF